MRGIVRDEDDYLDNWGDEIYSALLELQESTKVSTKTKIQFLKELARFCELHAKGMS